MSDQARRQPLPGWTKIYCLALAIGLASGVKDLFTVTQVYLERWQELIRWVVMGDLLFRTVGILLSCLLLWMVYRRDQRFLPLFMVDYVCRFMLAFMSIVVLRVPGINGLLSLLVPSLWLTYFHFSKKFKAIFAPETAGNAPAPADETRPRDRGGDAADGPRNGRGGRSRGKGPRGRRGDRRGRGWARPGGGSRPPARGGGAGAGNGRNNRVKASAMRCAAAKSAVFEREGAARAAAGPAWLSQRLLRPCCAGYRRGGAASPQRGGRSLPPLSRGAGCSARRRGGFGQAILTRSK